MRSEDGRDDGAASRTASATSAPAAGAGPADPRLHYPDLTVVTASGQRVAFELELQLKGAARRERILSAYAGDPRFDAVVYLVATPTGSAHAGAPRDGPGWRTGSTSSCSGGRAIASRARRRSRGAQPRRVAGSDGHAPEPVSR